MSLIRLRVRAGLSEALLVAYTALLEISCRGSNILTVLLALPCPWFNLFCCLLKAETFHFASPMSVHGTDPSLGSCVTTMTSKTHVTVFIFSCYTSLVTYNTLPDYQTTCIFKVFHFNLFQHFCMRLFCTNPLIFLVLHCTMYKRASTRDVSHWRAAKAQTSRQSFLFSHA